MTKRLVDIDDGLERQAPCAARTATLESTENGALAEVILRRRERVAVSLDYFGDLSRQGVLEDREKAWWPPRVVEARGQAVSRRGVGGGGR